jgi:predicted porin
MYSLKADGFVTKVSGGIIHGAPIAYDGAAVAAPSALHFGYDDLTVYQAGAQTTFAGLTLGANVKAGSTLDGYAFKPKGARNAVTYIVGATYVIGPVVVGASYFNAQTAGAFTPGAKMAKTLSEYGAAAGANYIIGKDLSLFLQYEYGHRHQPGNTALLNGNAQVQSIATGATLKW